MALTLQPLGDTALRIGVGTNADLPTHRRVRHLCKQLEQARLPGVVETTFAYTTVTVFYRPHEIRYADLCGRVEAIASNVASEASPAAQLITLPVCYDRDFGPDLEFVAKLHGLTTDAVIALHSNVNYLIHLLGFVPGFPYLGGLPKQLATPRLETPRMHVAAGAVGIGGEQTGVYPLATPAGWRIIGRTPVRLFDASRTKPVLLDAGDYLRFEPVTRERFEQIAARVAAGSYEVSRQPYEDAP